MAIRVLKYSNKTSYQASVRIEGRRLTRSFDRKTDAERWMRSQLEKRDLGELQVRNLPTVSEFSADWLQIRAAQVTPSTFALQQHVLKSMVLPKVGHIRIDSLSPSTIQLLMKGVVETGRSARTANIMLSVVRKLYTDAVDHFGFKVQNPATKVKKLKESPNKLEFWSKEEIDVFLKTVERHQPHNLAIFRFLLNTGARIGEAYALQWGDVDLARGYVCIRRTVDRIHHVAKETTKGNKMRYVGLNEVALQTLSHMKESQLTPPKSLSLVFPNQAGGIHFHSSFQRRCFDKCLKIAGVRKVRIHDLRHTFAAHFVMNGGSIYDLKQILGHSDIKMTERYAHLAPDYLKSRTALVSFS
jgi:integrase